MIGTMFADFADRSLGIDYAGGALALPGTGKRVIPAEVSLEMILEFQCK